MTLPQESEWVGWMVLLCMAFTDGDGTECLERESFTKLASYQKVSCIRWPWLSNICVWFKMLSEISSTIFSPVSTQST